MGSSSTNAERRHLVARTVAVKLALVAGGVYVTYRFYRSGSTVFLGAALAGWLTATVQFVADLRAGRKPWLPIDREVPAEVTDHDGLRRHSIAATVLGKLTVVVLCGYFVSLVHRAGMETLAVTFAVAGALYVLGRLWSDWRAGRPPWLPTKRVQRLDSAN